MPDDSDKAWGMLFESEAWPLPFRVKENIDISFDSKGSGADSAAPSLVSLRNVSKIIYAHLETKTFSDLHLIPTPTILQNQYVMQISKSQL